MDVCWYKGVPINLYTDLKSPPDLCSSSSEYKNPYQNKIWEDLVLNLDYYGKLSNSLSGGQRAVMQELCRKQILWLLKEKE